MNEIDKPPGKMSVQKAVKDQRSNAAEREVILHEEETAPVRRRIHPGLIAALILTIVGVFLLGWYLIGSSSDSGRPVPAPRSSVSETTPETLTNQTLTLSPEQVQNAGIEIETVGEQLSAESAQTSATGTVEANAYRQTPAMALVGGIVRRVVPQLGDNVGAGQTLAVIFSDEFAQTQSRYITLQTEAENARRNYERTQRLAAINQPGRSELEQAAKQRKAAEASLNEMRNRYERTTRLVLIGAASREELEQDTTKLRTAEAEVEEARLRETRAGNLLPISAEVRTASEEALNKLRTAETELASTRQRLILYGMPTGRINALHSATQVTSDLGVSAPSTGTVTARYVNVGEVVEANKELMRVTDLSSVWIVAQVYERDAGRLRIGGPATITNDAFPERVFRGQISYIDPQVDETTRTVKVRIEVGNPSRILKLGMFVRVSLGRISAGERTVPVVTASAVQNINERQIVFVSTGDPNTFELRPVRLGQEIDGRYPVIEGLTQGERVVTNGSFALRAEWLKSQQGQLEHQH
jgi:multidrug efflux pump subunit AcrA (membrane-fusion protein)